MNITPAYDEVVARFEELRRLKRPSRPISVEARRHYLGTEDGDDARDLAFDYDEELRLDFPVDRIEDR